MCKRLHWCTWNWLTVRANSTFSASEWMVLFLCLFWHSNVVSNVVLIKWLHEDNSLSGNKKQEKKMNWIKKFKTLLSVHDHLQLKTVMLNMFAKVLTYYPFFICELVITVLMITSSSALQQIEKHLNLATLLCIHLIFRVSFDSCHNCN